MNAYSFLKTSTNQASRNSFIQAFTKAHYILATNMVIRK
jgi:hypothetical protein